MRKHRVNRYGGGTVAIVTILCVLVFVGGAFLLFHIFKPQFSATATEEPSVSSRALVQERVITFGGALSPVESNREEFEQLRDPLLVLVNAAHEMPQGADSDVIERHGIMLDGRAMSAYEEMYEAATQAEIELWVASGYRSAAVQKELYEQEVADYVQAGMTLGQATDAAHRAVQKAGYSEHNTGLAVDFNTVSDDFQYTETYAWLIEHAQEFGFVLRFPEGKEEITGIMYEPWHFRYVGVVHAQNMKLLDMTLEEYVEYLRS